MKTFNIRVYGILINERNEVLLSDESRGDFCFTKFPGGGLEWGEGIVAALKREFEEELSISIEVGDLFYLTEHVQLSAFNKNDQLISLYYRVFYSKWAEIPTQEKAVFEGQETHRWQALSELKPEQLTFPIDRLVAERLMKGL